MRSQLLSIIFICCLGTIVYSNTFHNSFHFDDSFEIVNNPAIKNIHDPAAIWNFWPTRAVAEFSFALNYDRGGLDVVGYHVVNLLIHLGASIMAWWFALLTLSLPSLKKEKISRHAAWIAFFAGLIFLVHPLQTQPINYIYQRAALLAAFFYLSSLALYVKTRSTRLENPDSRSWIVYWTGSLLAAALSMFSKETAVSLPLIVCLYECCFLKSKEKQSWPWITPFSSLPFCFL